MTITQILDDRDPAVVYSPGWVRAGSSNEYNGTTSSASDPGLTATFAFQGTQVSVYGTLGPRNGQLLSPRSNFSIDNGSSFTYQAVQTTSVQYSTRFFTSPPLENCPHTLVVTNLIASDSLFLDYFLVLRDDKDSPPPGPPQPTGNSRSVDGNPPSSPNTGTIVGSAIGAAALVILGVAFMLWLRGRNRRKQDLDDTRVNSFRESRSMIEPFRPAHLSLTSSYLPSSGSSPNPQQQYGPYEISSLAPPPGYIAEASEQPGTGQVLPRLYLPSKFTREHR